MFALLWDVLVFVCLSVYYILEAVVLTFIPRRFRNKSVVGEVVLITGGGGGIGRLLAIKFATLGSTVVVWDINKKELEETVRLIRQIPNSQVYGYTCDVADREQIYETANKIKEAVGKVTILINNAGIVCGKTLMELPDHMIDSTFQVNILSHYWTTKAFLGDMMKDNHGHVVTVASVAGLMGLYKATDYSATKFATIGFHESLFTELHTHGYDGVHTTLICPYYINTGMFEGAKPRIIPMLEPVDVADQIVAAILANEVTVTIPWTMKWIIPMKAILPAKMCWALMYHVAKGPQSMMTFQGNITSRSMVDQNKNATAAR